MGKELNKSGSVVFRCTEQAVIQEILFSSLSLPTKNLINQSFSTVAQGENLDPTLHFLEALKQFGTADGWHLKVIIENTPLYMTFSGLSLDKGFIIVGNIFKDSNDQSKDKNFNPGEVSVNSQILVEDNQPFTSDMDEHELLDELSRLNNELINNKRELVRQNMAMQRSSKKKKP